MAADRENSNKVKILKEKPQPWVPIDLQIDPCREKTLMQEMERCINEIESSQFYHNFRDQLQTLPIAEHFQRVLRSESKMDMVIYGIGRLELEEGPRLQLSLAILMKKDFRWIGGIEVFDPILSATECRVLETLGCSVLSLDEEGRRQALKPTMFFMPHCTAHLYNNLLQANWNPSLLRNVIIFGNRFDSYEDTWDFFEFIHVLRRMFVAQKFTNDFIIRNYHYSAFSDSSLHFFNPTTMETRLQFINDYALSGDKAPTDLEIDSYREILLMQKMERCRKKFERLSILS